MNDPKPLTLALVGGASAVALCVAVVYLVHAFSGLPERVAEVVPTETPRQRFDRELREMTTPKARPSSPDDPRAMGAIVSAAKRDADAKRHARNRSIGAVDWELAYEESDDIKAFMEEAGPVAEQGDTSAQFAMYRALSMCRQQLRDPTTPADKRARCASLSIPGKQMKTDADRWLDRAATGDFPRALAQRSLERIAKARALRMTPAERTHELEDARADFVRALNSDDVAITWLAAHVVSTLYHDDPKSSRAKWVWRLTACEQGFPCGDDAPWLPELCDLMRDCRVGESGREFIRRQSGELASLLARARELRAALSAGALDEKQFEASVTSIPDNRPAGRSAAKAATTP
jgi:hypothetical protein